MEVNGQLHAVAALPRGKEPLVPSGQELWTRWRRKNSLPLPGIEVHPSSP
jgi:hypothetical protein